jgi:hypothetical protein
MDQQSSPRNDELFLMLAQMIVARQISDHDVLVLFATNPEFLIWYNEHFAHDG